MRYWHVMDAGKDSTDLLVALLDHFGSRLDYVIVRNQLRGENFDVLERSGAQQRALELGAKVITIKRLHEAVAAKIDAHSQSFWAATQPGDKSTGGLGLLERQRVRVWLQHASDELDRCSV